MVDGDTAVSGDGYTHLHPTIRLIAELSDEERIAQIMKPRWIEYPAAKKVLDKIQDLFLQPQSKRMENLLLTARSGAGKTSLIDRMNRIVYGELDTAYNTQRPLVTVLMPPRPTEKELLWSIGRALGTPIVQLSHLEGPHMRNEMLDQLRSLGVRILVIDEINSVLVGTAREQRTFLQFLRYLSNEIGASLVCVGTPEARQALSRDEQLRSRFSSVELPPWEPAGGDLQVFVNHLVKLLPLRQPSRVVSPALCHLLADRSGGITASICKAIRRAAVSAVQSGKEMIDPAGLQDDSVWDGIADVHPPFRSAARAQVRGTAS